MYLLQKYFPHLSQLQWKQFENLLPLYRFWNSKVNLVSRVDIENLYEHHVLHSLSIAKFCDFTPGTEILDLGTGGGFPGIPLAIYFPEVNFHLIDVIEKKTNVVLTISTDLGLGNVKVEKLDAGSITSQYDFIVCRAVTDTSILSSWIKPLIKSESNNDIPNGIILLKGGNLEQELAKVEDVNYKLPLDSYFEESYFNDKFLVYLSV